VCVCLYIYIYMGWAELRRRTGWVGPTNVFFFLGDRAGPDPSIWVGPKLARPKANVNYFAKREQ
jgi:hypothetical protein